NRALCGYVFGCFFLYTTADTNKQRNSSSGRSSSIQTFLGHIGGWVPPTSTCRDIKRPLMKWRKHFSFREAPPFFSEHLETRMPQLATLKKLTRSCTSCGK